MFCFQSLDYIYIKQNKYNCLIITTWFSSTKVKISSWQSDPKSCLLQGKSPILGLKGKFEMKSSHKGENPACSYTLHPVNLKSLEEETDFTAVKSQCAFNVVRFGTQLLALSGMFTLLGIYDSQKPVPASTGPSIKPVRIFLDVACVWFFQYPGQEYGREPLDGGEVARWHQYTVALAFFSGQLTGAISKEDFCLFVRLFCIFSFR